MTKDKLKSALSYAGLPIILTVFAFMYIGMVEAFEILLYLLLIIFGYIVSVSDIKTKKIPNKLIVAMFTAWAVVMIPKLFLDIDAAVEMLKHAALGSVVGGGLFLAVYLISRRGLGGGDVKFMTISGLYMGFGHIISAILYGTVFAALTGLILLAFKKIGKKDQIPFAPFLYTGILITVFWR